MKHTNESSNTNDIAVIGISGRFPEADTPHAFWQNLAAGKDSIRRIPEQRRKELEEVVGQTFDGEFIKMGYLDTVTRFEPGYFNISDEEARYMDPQHRLALELVEEAFQDAGYDPAHLSGENIGVFMASSKNRYSELTGPSPLRLVNALECAIAGRIAYTFNFFGPALAVDTACSSSLTALHHARLSLLNGECDCAVTGGVNIVLTPPPPAVSEQSPILSKTQCLRAFDKDADGTMGGEGGGILVLKTLAKALEDHDTIHAVIKGSGLNSDGRRANGLSAPNQQAQAELINRVIDTSGIDPLSVSYIETHGTGTVLGDPIEVEGISIAFNKYSSKIQSIPIGSVKTNVGHLDTVAATAGLMKVVLALKNKQIPPSLHYETPNPYIDFENSPVYVNAKLSDWDTGGVVRRAGVTSLGLIGTNAHAVLEEAPVPEPADTPDHPHIFTLSARTPASLDRMTRELLDYLEAHPQLSHGDVAYTLAVGRRHLPLRRAVHAASLRELAEALDTHEKPAAGKKTKRGFAPVFVYPAFDEKTHRFTVSGSQPPLFNRYYRDCLSLAGDTPRGRFLSFQYAASRVLVHAGLAPKAVFGIGIGNFIADIVQGKRSLEEGIRSAAAYGAPGGAVDADKLNAVIGKMVEKEYNLFLTFGTGPMIGDAVARQGGELSAVPVDETGGGFPYDALCRLYEEGADIQWRELYAGGAYRRVSLPTYAFDRKSYYTIADNLRPTAVPAASGSPPAEGAAPLIKEAVPLPKEAVPPAEFDDILDILQATTPDEIDLDFDFESNGGDSLAVMEAVESIKKTYRTTLEVQPFYTLETTQELIDHILEQLSGAGEGAPAPEPEAAAASDRPAPELPETQPFDAAAVSGAVEEPRKILVTGATGFLGAHLVDELLSQTPAQVVCLTRGDNDEAALKKCRKTWNFYFGDRLEEHIGERLLVVAGDITRDNLGLADETHRDLVETVDTVVHGAADVRHEGKYQRFKEVNVDGTRRVIDFCLAGTPKRLHHMSTFAVTGRPLQSIHFREDHLDVGQDLEGSVYGLSKYEAEQLVRGARAHGLNAAVHRVGNLAGRFEDGVFQPNIDTNELYGQVKAVAMLGRIPAAYMENRRVEWTPVDLCCRGIVNLIRLKDSAGYTFHMAHPVHLEVKAMIAAMRERGIDVEAVDDRAFTRFVAQRVESGAFQKEISHIFQRLDLDAGDAAPDEQDGEPAVTLTYDGDFTVRVLERTGFTWPLLDDAYLQKMIKHCIDVGYI